MNFKNVLVGGIFFVILVAGVFALLKNLNRILPDLGKVVEMNGITCIKFRDQNKNYVWGEIKVGFDNKLTGTEAHSLLKTQSLRLRDADLESYTTGSSYVVDVPRGSEEDIVNKLKTIKGIEKVSLVHCE